MCWGNGGADPKQFGLGQDPALLGWEESLQLGKAGGFRVSELENLVVER